MTTFLVVLTAGIILNVGGIVLVAGLARRHDESRGEIVVPAGHRCQPPGASRFCHEWKINREDKYPVGTVWRCPCGDAWRSTDDHLWLTWARDRQNDAAVSASGSKRGDGR